jgi:hypothetical protein
VHRLFRHRHALFVMEQVPPLDAAAGWAGVGSACNQVRMWKARHGGGLSGRPI